MQMRKFLISAACAISFLPGLASAAVAEADALPSLKWSFDGIFGSYDRPQLRRGSQVFLEVCSGCHSLEMVYYRNLMDIGFTTDQAKAMASDYEIEDGPDDEGEMYMRPAKLSDRFVKPFPNKNAARFANGGAFPPDLSVITKARKGGTDYIYGLMTGYLDDAPADFDLSEGTYYNKYYPGHQIFMAQPLYEEAVDYEDGTEPTLEQHAKDITAFLAWAANPEMEERKRLGIKVILYLIILTAMFYALKRRIWSNISLEEFVHDPYVVEYEQEMQRHKRPN